MIFITLRLVHINYHHKSQLCFCNQRYLKFHVCNIRNMKFWSMLIALNVCKCIHNGIYAGVVVSFIVCQTLNRSKPKKEITNSHFQSYYQLNIFFCHKSTFLWWHMFYSMIILIKSFHEILNSYPMLMCLQPKTIIPQT